MEFQKWFSRPGKSWNLINGHGKSWKRGNKLWQWNFQATSLYLAPFSIDRGKLSGTECVVHTRRKPHTHTPPQRLHTVFIRTDYDRGIHLLRRSSTSVLYWSTKFRGCTAQNRDVLAPSIYCGILFGSSGKQEIVLLYHVTSYNPRRDL